MIIERVTLLPPAGSDERAPITPTDVTLRSFDRSRQTVVLEVPAATLTETPLAANPGEGAGYEVVLTTTKGRTYSGYVEVVAEGTDNRFYWCGLDM